MFARRTLVLGALALAGLSADTASAQMPAPDYSTTYSVPLAMPATVVSQSTPVASEATRTRGLRGRRTARTSVVTPASYTTPTTATTPVMAQPMTMTQSTIPMPMPTTVTTPSTTTTTPSVTPTPGTVTMVAPAGTATTTPVVVTEGTTTMGTTTTAAPARRGLFSRIFRR